MVEQGQGRTISAVVFDLDDTLYPEVDYVVSGFRMLARQLARPEVDADQLYDAFWDTFLNGPRDRVFNRVLDELGIGAAPQLIAELVQRYRCHRPDICLTQETRRLLETLREHYRLGVITDGYLPAQKLKAEALELPGLVDRIIYTEELGREFWKPNPHAFELMSEALDCPATRCCYVGDNLSKDFVAPNRLGWLTVRLANGSQIHGDQAAAPGGQPQRTIRDLAELKVLIGAESI